MGAAFDDISDAYASGLFTVPSDEVREQRDKEAKEFEAFMAKIKASGRLRTLKGCFFSKRAEMAMINHEGSRCYLNVEIKQDDLDSMDINSFLQRAYKAIDDVYNQRTSRFQLF